MRSRLVLILLFLVFLSSPVLGFESETGSSGERVSNLEDVIYDEQATYAFRDPSYGVSGFGPHWFYGSQVVEKSDGDISDTFEDTGTEGEGDSIVNYYVQPQDGWGQGEEQTVSPPDETYYIDEDPRTGYYRANFDPLSSYSNPEDQCGSLTRTDEQIDCPRDSGLPDQTSTPQSNDNSVTDNLNSFSVTTNGNTYSDTVDYQMDLLVQEPYGTDSVDISGSTGDSTESYDIGDLDSSVENVPNFFLENDNQINAIYYESDGYTELGTVDDTEVIEGSIDHYTSNGDTVYEDCTPSGQGVTCDSTSACIDPGGSETVYDWQTNTDLQTLSTDTTEYETSQSGSGGYSENTGSNNLEVTVTRDVPDLSSPSETVDTTCTDETVYTGCDGLTSCISNGGTDCDCDLDNSADEYTETGTADDDSLETHEVTFEYELASLKDNIEVFNLDPAQNPNSMDVREALFEGTGISFDGLTAVSVGGEGYFSMYKIWSEDTVLGLGVSDHSISVSGFDLVTDGIEFKSLRDYFASYKPDGQNNLKQGYVAIKHDVSYDTRDSTYEIVGSTERISSSGDVVQRGSGAGLDNNLIPHIKSQLDSENFQCPDESVYCVVAVDPYINQLGTTTETDTSSNWGGTINPNQGLEFRTRTRPTDYSLGVCKLYQSMTDESDINDGQYVQCEYDSGPGGGGSDPQCDEAYNRFHRMEGPEVNDLDLSEQSDRVTEDYQACVEVNQCVLHGNSVAEGTVANVAFDDFSSYPSQGYETGTDSPDAEVCLNINEEYTYNNYYDSNDDSSEFGGQWYDLDNPIVEDYLKGETSPHSDFNNDGEGPGLVSGADSSGRTPPEGADDISQYWRENPFPQHPDYNPKGGQEGINLLADCAPGLACGDDSGNERDGFDSDTGYYAFFEENSYDDDKHPQGLRDNTSIDPVSEGVLTMARKHPENNQLSPGNDDYSYVGPNQFEDTEISDTTGYTSVAMGYGHNRSWTVDSKGYTYPGYGSDNSGPYPGTSGSYYVPTSSIAPREKPSDSGVTKEEKGFGNSLALIASQDFTGENQQIREGEGFWTDPDNLRARVDGDQVVNFTDPNTDQWKEMVNFKIDITGPDSGLGWDYGNDPLFDPSLDASRSGNPHPSEIEFRDTGSTEPGSVVFTDIHWEENQTTGNILEGLQPPMCGDDSREYLLEEMGESINSQKYEGRYACGTSQNYCVSYEVSGKRLFANGERLNTEEPGESEGRLKGDEEICVDQRSELNMDQSMWFDQDYANNLSAPGTTINLCRENDLYGSTGVRWINSDQINSHPLAFREGIDDSWNPRMAGLSHDSLESDPNGSDWNLGDDITGGGHTPVQTGTNGDTVADPLSPTGSGYGYCGGDDASEYFIYQDSNTRLLETNQSVVGVAQAPNSCVADNSQLNNLDTSDLDDDFPDSELQDERMIYREGTTLEFTPEGSSTRRQIGCYNGEWWGDWPIVMQEDVARVSLGTTGYTSFLVINPTSTEKTFDIGLNPRGPSDTTEDLEQMTVFEDSGTDSINVTVPAGSSNSYRLRIRGNRDVNTTGNPNANMEVFGESRDGSLDGEDQVDIVVDDGNVENTEGQTRDVPGLTMVQLVVMTVISAILFFRS